ncbi:MAG: leucyl aminopeptidase [Alphaproteobacteria bacterium]|nr:leucyl aminopeptidase [Alphaproteobacteria bacterium]
MTTAIKFKKSLTTQSPLGVLLISEGGALGENAKALDKKLKGFIKSAIKDSEKFTGKHGQTLLLPVPGKSDFKRILCLGIGKTTDLDQAKAEALGGKLYAAVKGAGAQEAALMMDALKTDKKQNPDALYASMAMGFKLRSYRFDKYKTKKGDDDKTIKSLSLIGSHYSAVSGLFRPMSFVAEGVFVARDLVNEPPNTINPPAYAKYIKKELSGTGVRVEVLDEKKLKALKMGGILAVGQGSAQKPCIVIMHWNGSAKSKTSAPIALVGKGVTFDTGGISIKPSAGMDEMKMDMGGSAAVVGTMKALAARKSKAHVIGIVGLAENMPSSNAYRPGDIIKSYSGKTIEIMNTDAEGRLVLADCLTYVQKKYKPGTVIDLATLTGAMMVALGHEYCGTFVNDDALWQGLETAAGQTTEKLWRMPLDEVWKKDMESLTADLQNLARTNGRWGGACTAAGFLEHFIEDGVKWAHMDIAGTAYIKADKPTVPKFGTGFGVRVLDRLIANEYE